MSLDSSTGVVRRHPLAECEKCSLLVEKGTVFVPSIGPPSADIAIVGEAPGYQEAETGIPFSGPSGRLLNRVLDHHRIERADCYLTNAVLCRPPSNRTPTKEEVSACRPRLIAELQSISPNTVITLGNTATQCLLSTRSGITVTRVGPPKVAPHLLGETKIIPTFHPAACLRSSDYFPYLVADVGKINPKLQQEFEVPVYKVFDDEVSAVHALQQILHRDGEELVIDIEVGIEKDTSFDHSENYQFLCIGIGYSENRVAVIGEEALKKIGRAHV